MLARTVLHSLPQQTCSSSAPVRAPTVTLQQARALVVARTSYSSRSNSPRSESWRSSWRTELDHGNNGNGNGNGNGASSHNDADYYTAYRSDAASTSTADHDRSSWYFAADEGRQDGYESETDDDDEEPQAWSNDSAQTGEDAEAGSSGFFTDAFKEALKSALQRSPLYGGDALAGVGSGDEESVEPQPYENEVETFNRPIFTDQFRQVLKDSLARQQEEMDTKYSGPHGSDDEDPAVPYVPLPPPRREMSPIEEIIATALGASQLHLRRLNLMRNEIEAAIERETKQIERLEFAMNKTHADQAYYKSLEQMLQEQRSRKAQ